MQQCFREVERPSIENGPQRPKNGRAAASPVDSANYDCQTPAYTYLSYNCVYVKYIDL